MKGIFISYRRQDAPGHAGRLYDRLQERFGADRVFMDVAGSIEPGLPFDQVIEEAIGSCEVLLVMMGDEWLTVSDEKGRRRIDDENDYLRLEAATALARNIRVIPVLVSRAGMPSADELPQDLKGLAKRQAIELSDERWNFDVDRLVKVLEGVLEPKPTVSSGSEAPSTPATSPSRAATYGVIALLLVALGGYGFWHFGGGSPPTLSSMPKLVGLPLDTAQKEIAAAGLGPAELTYEETRQVPPGTVIRQAPEEGVSVGEGIVPKLVVAKSRTTSNQSSKGPVVPNLVGKTLDQAIKIAGDLGVKLKVEILASATAPPTQILRQMLPEGTAIEPGSVIPVVASDRTGLAPAESGRGARYFAVGETFAPDSASSLVLRKGNAFVSKTLGTSIKEGLYLKPGVSVQIALFTGKEPSKNGCVDSIKIGKVTDLEVVPVTPGGLYCLATRTGTIAAVTTRSIFERPDKDGDQALIGYWIWK